MPKRKTEQTGEEEEEEFNQSDGDKKDSGDDDNQEKAEPKKSKKQTKVKKVAKKPSDGSGVSGKIELGKNKFVDVREFKGMVLIDIREYYETADGEMKPGKKGIALNLDQWESLKENMEDISDKIEELQ